MFAMAIGKGKIQALAMAIGWRIPPELVVPKDPKKAIVDGLFVFIQKNKNGRRTGNSRKSGGQTDKSTQREIVKILQINPAI